jgi:phenylacetate-coenzyme A ligase PaaK-like adenylate-forming protein
MEIMPLDSWVLRKIGASGSILTREDINGYQLGKVRETIEYARLKSPFYSRLLSNYPADSISLSQISELPFTTAGDISRDSRQFATLPPHEISRIVTLHTSGTTGQSKRFYFTKEDLDLTIDFFSSGMSILVKPGQRVLILLPGTKPDSVGDLLARGLAQIGVESFIHGPIQNVQSAVDEIHALRIDSLVGIPTQVLSLARSGAGKAIPRGMIKSVLLSADYVPSAIADELARVWDCLVIKHYGMTEMGLGGAVECRAQDGYHLREADLFFEIVDPDTGKPLKDGETGEIVFTTLTRKGMPLIRYRTGDLSHIISELCSCGSAIKRIGAVEGRLDGRIDLSNGSILTLPEMDEALFRVKGLLNYSAALSEGDGSDHLELTVHAETDGNSPKVLPALMGIPVISKALAEGSLQLAPISLSHEGWFTTGVAKRMLRDCRKQPSGKSPLP